MVEIGMFRAPFSFEGRIRRTEYGYSILLYAVVITILNVVSEDSQRKASPLLSLLYIPLIWFLLAQGSKRCHDLGVSGWCQIIPLYVFWLVFQNGSIFTNKYGQNPKQPIFPTGKPGQYNKSELLAKGPVISRSPTFTSEEPSIPKQIKPKPHPTALGTEKTDADQITELEINNVNYGLLQEMLRSLRTIKSVKAISYEFNDTTGKATIKHVNSSQELLNELYGITQGMEILAVANGYIKLKLK